VVPWQYPTEGAADLPAAACAQVQEEVSRAEYLSGSRSPNWVGNLVARIFRLDTTSKAGNSTVGRYLAALYTKGVIATIKRGKVNVVVPGNWTGQ